MIEIRKLVEQSGRTDIQPRDLIPYTEYKVAFPGDIIAGGNEALDFHIMYSGRVELWRNANAIISLGEGSTFGGFVHDKDFFVRVVTPCEFLVLRQSAIGLFQIRVTDKTEKQETRLLSRVEGLEFNLDQNSLRLWWPNVDSAAGYQICCRTTVAEQPNIRISTTTENSFTEILPTKLSNRRYTVRAFNAQRFGSFSDVIEVPGA